MGAGGHGDTDVVQLLARARDWYEVDPDPATAAELRELCHRVRTGDRHRSADAVAELTDLFGGTLTFGTAGVRGRVGPGPNRMNRVLVRRLAAGVAAWVRDVGLKDEGVVVGRDARHRSDDFVADIVEVVAGAGVAVHVLPAPVPTPVLAYAVRHLGCGAGIMVTASHNPATDNGCKVYDDRGRQVDPDQADAVAAAMAAAGPVADIPVAGAGDPRITRHGLEVVDAYLAEIGRVVRHRPDAPVIQAVHTSLHGVAAQTVRRACASLGFVELHEVLEQQEVDPDFPTVAFPNPEEPGALDLLLGEAAFRGADVAFAHDPDADRLAMAVCDPQQRRPRDVETWRVLTGDELGCLLADHLIRRGGLPEGATMATTIVSSTLLRRIATDAGLAYAETLTGFKWIVRAAPEGRLALGYEEALGYCVGDAVADKDGISAMLLACEMVSTLVGAGLTVFDRLDDLARRHGVHVTGQWSVRLDGSDGGDRIAAAMTRLRDAPPTRIGGRHVAAVNDLATEAPGQELPPADVVGLVLPGARVIVRPSGTEPKLKCYIEVVEPVEDGTDVGSARARAEEGRAELIEALPDVLGLG